MPKRKAPPIPPKEQFKRFVEVAREQEVDTKAAEKAFKKVVPPTRKAAKSK